jgi:hypothetical protein
MELPLGMVFSMRSALTATSCHNSELAEGDVGVRCGFVYNLHLANQNTVVSQESLWSAGGKQTHGGRQLSLVKAWESPLMKVIA